MSSRWYKIVGLTSLIILSLLLASCTRPISPDTADDASTEVAPASEETPDPNIGGGLPGDTPSAPLATPEVVSAIDTPPADTPVATESVPTPTDMPEPATPTAEPVDQPDDPESGGVAPTSETSDETATSEATADPLNRPETIPHVVQANENLYRIGLQYGLSWVVIAEYNNITNPTQLTAGQTILIPPSPTASATPTPQDPGPTPSPLTETIHIVRPGDNLFRIGLRYGMSWTQVAEANGIVNPNQIYVGQELKIPVNTPGPTPDFTHVVRPGETLFSIALRYGVAWTAVASANNIQSPHVIYEGQTLIIPGSP